MHLPKTNPYCVAWILFTIAAKINETLFLNRIRPSQDNSLEKSELISKNMIYKFSDSDDFLNHRRSTRKQFRGNFIVCRFLSGHLNSYTTERLRK